MHNEVLTDEELIERFKELINEFMTRPDRHYSCKTNMRWTLDHGNQIKYSVIISINQTSDSDIFVDCLIDHHILDYKTTMLSSKNQDDMKQSINRLDFSSIINTEKSMWTGSFSPVWLQRGMHWPPNLNKNKQQPIIDNESTNSYSIE
ncbi:unnamed protein product [Rotaria sordida]|uniref:Uncharacterized protein n=1 Tax=Rotaria sordida TaxID=392033 RepID=A0A815EW21_9BILA|nr:unnamed protein product [Rotaria sordida]CAF3848485.1 unnamed protein product [Rotaria sordida]